MCPNYKVKDKKALFISFRYRIYWKKIEDMVQL